MRRGTLVTKGAAVGAQGPIGTRAVTLTETNRLEPEPLSDVLDDRALEVVVVVRGAVARFRALKPATTLAAKAVKAMKRPDCTGSCSVATVESLSLIHI